MPIPLFYTSDNCILGPSYTALYSINAPSSPIEATTRARLPATSFCIIGTKSFLYPRRIAWAIRRI